MILYTKGIYLLVALHERQFPVSILIIIFCIRMNNDELLRVEKIDL